MSFPGYLSKWLFIKELLKELPSNWDQKIIQWIFERMLLYNDNNKNKIKIINELL